MAGSSGGSWKVAYADFVTAMMALFLVLWLTAQDQKIKEAVAEAFNNPFNPFPHEVNEVMPNANSRLGPTSPQGKFDSPSPLEMEMLEALSQNLQKAIARNPDIENNNSVKVELTSDGLKVTVLDRVNKPIFQSGSADFTEYGDWVFSTLAWEISRYRNYPIELTGHTETSAAPNRNGADKWELTAGRANAALHCLTRHGVEPVQFRRVIGAADVQPLPDYKPTDEMNRRVTVFLNLARSSRR